MTEKKFIRDAFGEALVELGRENEDIVVLSGDLEDSTKALYFKKEFPERFFNIGIAEQDMVGTAAGLAIEGFIPFACSFGVFLTNRAYDMIRITVCYNNLNVKLVGSHGGITVGPDSATAQCLEDLSIMRALPNMTVICPADPIETKKATSAMAEMSGPAYLRLARPAFPVLTKDADPFIIGKANILKDGNDVTIIACGIMVSEAVKAAEVLGGEGINARIINMHTIKPIDEEAIIRAAEETGAVVTAEDHQIHGGLGSAVSEVLVKKMPAPVEIVAVDDTFGESGEMEELMQKYHISYMDIAEAVKRAISRKMRQ